MCSVSWPCLAEDGSCGGSGRTSTHGSNPVDALKWCQNINENDKLCWNNKVYEDEVDATADLCSCKSPWPCLDDEDKCSGTGHVEDYPTALRALDKCSTSRVCWNNAVFRSDDNTGLCSCSGGWPCLDEDGSCGGTGRKSDYGYDPEAALTKCNSPLLCWNGAVYKSINISICEEFHAKQACPDLGEAPPCAPEHDPVVIPPNQMKAKCCQTWGCEAWSSSRRCEEFINGGGECPTKPINFGSPEQECPENAIINEFPASPENGVCCDLKWCAR